MSIFTSFRVSALNGTQVEMDMNVQGVGGKPQVPQGVAAGPGAGTGGGPFFQAILEGETAVGGPVKISSHAQRRLHSRDIQWGSDQMEKLGEAVDRAGKKGARESLILLDELALVVSIANRTVITAMQKDKAKEGIFTNIDSVVIV